MEAETARNWRGEHELLLWGLSDFTSGESPVHLCDELAGMQASLVGSV